MRLQLYVQMRIHEVMTRATSVMRDAVSAGAGSEGKLSPSGLMHVRMALDAEWNKAFKTLRSLIEAAQREAGAIPFGTLAEQHAYWIGALGRKAASNESRKIAHTLHDAIDTSNPVFQPQLNAIIQAANKTIYADGLTLSGRLWKLDQQSRAGIQSVLFAGVQQGKSAWDIAKDLERYLGASADCPRWTSTRLYTLTKRDIAAGDPRGLIRGDECAAQGVAYNALRLARTEIQRVHNLATQTLMQQMPWVTEEQMKLSPAHPEEDVCDEIIAKGRDGQGIYPVGTLSLPIHPNCLCYLVAVEMPADDFVGQLRGWMRGDQQWEAMDTYAETLGAQLSPAMNAHARTIQPVTALTAGVIAGIAAGFIVAALLDWLTGDRARHDARMEAE